MRIKIINPNTTAAFTERVRAAAAKVAAPGTLVIAGNPIFGTPTVESHAEEAVAAVGVMSEVMAGETEGVDGYVVACFGDTGVQAAREIARGPVVGMSEAALYAASIVASRFAIVTLPRRTQAHARRVLHETGLGHRCALHAIDVPVSDLEDEADAIRPILTAAARRAIDEDDAEAIILGCAGLSDLIGPLGQDLGVPVIDGVLVGLKLIEALIATGLSTSRRSTYAPLSGGFRLP